MHEIELGKIDQGFNLLIGLVDVLHLQGVPTDQTNEKLVQHMLHQLLLEDPIHRQAFCHEGDSAGFVDVISNLRRGDQLNSTGRHLFEATSQMSFIRVCAYAAL